MFAVGRIGSYISRGVNTVSGPFLPLGGAVDIIVVEQQDGSFKSTPWYVRFGKLQGVWKATERVVNINVNGVDADFHMYLDHKGEAFFVREVDAVEGELESYPSFADEMEVNSDKWRTQTSLSYNFDANRPDLVSELEGSDRKILARSTSSRRGRIFGLPIGRRSVKENGLHDGEAGVEVDSFSSVERAEIAAELLEVRWTTNLHTSKHQKARVCDENKGDSSVSSKGNVASGTSDCLQAVSGHVETDAQVSCLISPENSMEFILEETYIAADLTSVKSDISDGVHNSCVNKDQISLSKFSEVFESSSELPQTVVNEDINCSASSEASCDNINELQENISKCNGGEVTLLNISATHLTDEVGTSRGCIIGEFPLEDSPAVEPGKSVTGSINELCIEDLSAGTSNLNSLPLVLEKESSIANVTSSPLSSSALYCVEHPNQGRNNIVMPSDDKEEQFFFSDLDDSEVEKVKRIQTSSSGSSLGSREDEVPDSIILDKLYQVTSKPTQDNKLNNHPNRRMSCPISISKVHNDSDEALAPVAESLSIMTFDGDNPSLNAPQTLSRSLDSPFEALKAVNNDVPLTSGLSGGQQQVAQSHLTTVSSQIPDDIRKIISDPAVEVSLCRHLLFEGMGYEAAAQAFDAEKLDIGNFLSLGLDILDDDKLVVRIGGLYFPWDAALPIASAIGSQERLQILEPKGMIAVGEADYQNFEGVAQKSINSGGGSRKRWPFSFKRSDSMQNKNYSFETAAEGPKETAVVVPRSMKKKLRAKFPSSEQLVSLNLKEGKNVVTFTFSTANLGEQKVEARIFLWKWNARIVISDVDGTITKSDVLGQFMPLMGIDWSQTGVTHLFSAIKENGYQLLFLSARSISQAYHTRQFLFNLKQDGKALPEGPVLISPDGLFPSLYREVIRRAPHEFKIACLEDVKVLFPPDHNPFYAGFGNRDTDELSYLRVGIPKGKIFTINPKGQVVVNRRVDSKSYTSLHVLVHDMFPPTTLHEQEDYNSWNFWRLPPQDAII